MKTMTQTTRVWLSLLLAALVQTAFAQKQNNGEATLAYQLTSPLANFFEVSNRYRLEPDTIFYVDRGFRIRPGIDEFKKSGTTYVVIRYFDIRGYGRQPIADSSARLAEGDSLPVHFPLFELPDSIRNDRFLAMEKSEFEKLDFDTLFARWPGEFASGQLTIPFKLRAKQGENNSQITTDVTLGAYVGWRCRISRRQPFFITLPVNLGLTFVNINENTTSTTESEGSGIVPGWTFATGLIFEYNKVNAGVVVGRDYASGIGDDWIYHNKNWWSFAIGYSFMR